MRDAEFRIDFRAGDSGLRICYAVTGDLEDNVWLRLGISRFLGVGRGAGVRLSSRHAVSHNFLPCLEPWSVRRNSAIAFRRLTGLTQANWCPHLA